MFFSFVCWKIKIQMQLSQVGRSTRPKARWRTTKAHSGVCLRFQPQIPNLICFKQNTSFVTTNRFLSNKTPKLGPRKFVSNQTPKLGPRKLPQWRHGPPNSWQPRDLITFRSQRFSNFGFTAFQSAKNNLDLKFKTIQSAKNIQRSDLYLNC